MCKEEAGSGDWHKTLRASGQVVYDKHSSMKIQNAMKHGKKGGQGRCNHDNTLVFKSSTSLCLRGTRLNEKVFD